MPSLFSLTLLIACTQDQSFLSEMDPGPPPVGTQPLHADWVEDRILQMAAPQVDILWVIDPSCSMGPYQTALAANFPSFIQFFLDSELDWHVGVTSTDMDGVLADGSLGRLRSLGGPTYLTPETEAPLARFADIASMGTQGSSSERGTSAVHAALTVRLDTDNQGFIRPGSALHTIVITDEANQIADGELHFDGWVRWYQGLRVSTELRTFSSIIGPLGIDYERATTKVGGTSWSIDTDSWDVVLERLGLAAAGLQREFFLSQDPDPDTLQVWLELHGVPGRTGETVNIQLRPVQTDATTGVTTGHYTYVPGRNSVLLEEPPPETTAIVSLRYLPKSGLPPF